MLYVLVTGKLYGEHFIYVKFETQAKYMFVENFRY